MNIENQELLPDRSRDLFPILVDTCYIAFRDGNVVIEREERMVVRISDCPYISIVVESDVYEMVEDMNYYTESLVMTYTDLKRLYDNFKRERKEKYTPAVEGME